MPPRKLLLIGWDAADWKIIRPLLAAGHMPALAKLMREGIAGNLATINPPLSPMLWTSIATGKRPYKHGIHGFTEVDPSTGGIRPITNLSRRTRAVWNILQLNGLRSQVTGWWPSHPAEPISGAMVSNRFQVATGAVDADWPLPPGAVHPARLEPLIEQLRIYPHELDQTHLLPFVPRAAEVDQTKDRHLDLIARFLAESASVHAVATQLLQSEPWDFAAVYYDAIDHFSHAFMRFHPPRRPNVPEHAFELYHGVVAAAYRYHDMLLATLLRLAGDDTTVILISDHGFHSDHLRPADLTFEPAAPAAEHRFHGIFVARGPGLRRGAELQSANLLDVCPTILTLFDLPIGADMDGKPLHDLFEQPPAVRTIPSWDAVPGDDGSHPPGLTVDSGDARTALAQLVALGYVAAPDADAWTTAEQTERELRYNLAQSLMDNGLYGRAEPILEELHRRWPDEHRFGIKLAACYHAIGRTAKVGPLSRALVRHRLREAVRARRQLAAMTPEQRERASPLLLARSRPDRDGLWHFLSFADFAVSDFAAADKKLRRTSPAYQERPIVLDTLAEISLRLRRWNDAEALFRRALAADSENADAWRGIARARLGRRDFPGATEAALESIRLVFARPISHFLLGMSWFRQAEFAKAVQAFEVTLRQNPTYPAAYRMLGEIYTRFLGDVPRGTTYYVMAQEARRRVRAARERETSAAADPAPSPHATELPPLVSTPPVDVPSGETITIVTGLPRSGTSMTMQMLAAGGLAPFTDGQRTPDASNPHGYLEHEAVKHLARDASFLAAARGQVVKVVAPLLPFLPLADASGQPLHYRVLFLRRPFADVLASQSRMLGAADADPAALERAYRAQLVNARNFLLRHRIPGLDLDYDRVCADPPAAARTVQAFLGVPLDLDAMAATVQSRSSAPAS